MPDTDVRVVLVTTPPGQGAGIARDLVEARLAACVNVVGSVRSIYRWEGKVCDEGEELLVAKTVASRVDALIARVREIHPYSVPEVIALPVVAGSAPYLEWVAGETL
jgi:periplasmic divalent cation tolerance protein